MDEPAPSDRGELARQLRRLGEHTVSAVVALAVGAVATWLLRGPRPLLAVIVGFAAGLIAGRLPLPAWWMRVTAGAALLAVTAAVTVLLPDPPSGRDAPGETGAPPDSFDVVGETDLLVDFDVTDGPPRTTTAPAADGMDVLINLDQEGGRVRMIAADGRVAPVGSTAPAADACSTTTRWTVESIDVVESPYLCVETTQRRLVVVQLGETVPNSRPPRATFTWSPADSIP